MGFIRTHRALTIALLAAALFVVIFLVLAFPAAKDEGGSTTGPIETITTP